MIWYQFGNNYPEVNPDLSSQSPPVHPIMPRKPVHLFYLNALFDQQLGGFDTGKLARATAEMTILFSFMGGESDRVLLDVEMPDDFRNYLLSINVKPLQITNGLLNPLEGNIKSRDEIPVPWGWDQHTFTKLKMLGLNCYNPDLCIVKKVNSRQFHNLISDRFGLGVPGSTFCDSYDTFLGSMEKLEAFGDLVVKPSFGGSGYGFRIIKKGERKLCQKEIEALIKHGGMVIEPWCKRVYDFSSSITIQKNGYMSSIRHQRSFSNMHGVFIGIYMAPEDPVIEKYASVQEQAVRNAAQALFDQGYFGPAGFDSFAYIDNLGKERVAPVIEINARHSMSDVAHAVRNRYAPNKYCFFRLISKKRCSLPDDYNEWKKVLKKDHFDPGTQEGVILLTPLRLRHESTVVQPIRNGFFLSAGSEKELFEMDERLRRLLE